MISSGSSVYGPDVGAPLQLSIPVFAGSTIQIRALSFKAPADFELRMQVR